VTQRPGKNLLFVLIILGLLSHLEGPPLEILVSFFNQRRDVLKNVVLSAALSVALTSDI
jgi:hypothetical protein